MIAATNKRAKLYKNFQPARMPKETDTLEVRVLTALKTLRAVDDPDTKILRQFDGRAVSWPEVVRSEHEGYGYDLPRVRAFKPTPKDVSRMLDDLALLNGLEKRHFRMIWWRSLELPFSFIAARIARSDETARRWYKNALVEVSREALRVGYDI